MAIPQIMEYPAPSGIALQRKPLDWTLEPSRAALLIHDMQNYFVAPYASKAFVDAMVQRIAAVRECCHALNIPVYYTAQPGDQPKDERGLLTDFWGPGMPEDGNAKSIVPGLEPTPELDEVLLKHRYSAFAKSDLLKRMQNGNRDQLIICGVYAHIGCLVTATEAFMSDIQPFVVSDALGDFSLDLHEMAVRHMAHCSSKIMSCDEMLAELGKAL
ncbi:bifunctional isochorismate lyase/aryl carrier protein [Pseudomonas sp. BS3782 TE3695]|jgi:bifunctional isochorismate lyase/aryl carrier protein|uniref:isochorismatase family protein n=1 Tax=Pseudomonas sp. BS3782 TE3695 TaxID=3349323 RepID=UPI003D23A6AC